jgi:hypothetical protein
MLAELRKNIGAEISYQPKSSLLVVKRGGILREIRGKNLLVDNDWLWYPDLCEIVIVKAPDKPAKKLRGAR